MILVFIHFPGLWLSIRMSPVSGEYRPPRSPGISSSLTGASCPAHEVRPTSVHLTMPMAGAKRVPLQAEVGRFLNKL